VYAWPVAELHQDTNEVGTGVYVSRPQSCNRIPQSRFPMYYAYTAPGCPRVGSSVYVCTAWSEAAPGHPKRLPVCMYSLQQSCTGIPKSWYRCICKPAAEPQKDTIPQSRFLCIRHSHHQVAQELVPMYYVKPVVGLHQGS